MRTCHRCGQPWGSEKKTPGVKEICEHCSSYLHACLNCRFYDPKLHNQCAIPTTEWVGDKTGANFCDEFEFRDAQSETRDRDAAASARDALDSLFGGDGNESRPDALDSMKRLFDE